LENTMSYSYALDGFYDDLIPTTPRPRIDRRFVAALVGVAALGTAVVLGTPRVVEAYRGYQAAQVEAAAARAAWAPAELPREWRWEPQAVAFDHMFRSER
jgi:hypothetical protein